MATEVITEPQKPFVHLADFDGPLDLLLHLIRKDEVEIYDIPIEKITKQYVAILEANQKYQLEIAGEYFVMASTLMRIKSQMLLPAPPVMVDDEAEFEDPREELVDQLLEYQRYQAAAKHLEAKAAARQREYTREAMAAPTEIIAHQVQPGVTIEELRGAFEALLKRRQIPELPVAETAPEKVTVAERLDYIKAQLTHPVRFVDLFADQLTRDNLVTTFLALLELCRHQVVQVTQSTAFGPLIVTKGNKFDGQPSEN